MDNRLFTEVGHTQLCKNGNSVCGDSFISRRDAAEGRIVAVLADGLGSGIKASVLSLLTSTIAARCVADDLDIRQTARTIMETLPVCAVRKIGYSTFTIIDIDVQGGTSIIEFDNPNLLWISRGALMRLDRQVETLSAAGRRSMELRFSRVDLAPEDRLVVFSDGVSQAGMGNDNYPLGWTQQGIEIFCMKRLREKPDASAQELSDNLVAAARSVDAGLPKDDISAAVIYLRKPRTLLVVTGPPFDRRRDREIAELCAGFKGMSVVCGGTTGSIIARELNRTITLDMSGDCTVVPPPSRIEGIDLVTEGTITLSRLCTILETDGAGASGSSGDPVGRLRQLLMGSDHIDFLVGTRVNEAHQDPTLPVELDMRRNTIRRICRVLEERYFKTTSIRFV